MRAAKTRARAKKALLKQLMSSCLEKNHLYETYWPCWIVRILKPNVGLIVVTSSWRILLTSVVLPALSRPLEKVVSFMNVDTTYTHLQHKNSNLLIFDLLFANNRQQSHCVYCLYEVILMMLASNVEGSRQNKRKHQKRMKISLTHYNSNIDIHISRPHYPVITTNPWPVNHVIRHFQSLPSCQICTVNLPQSQA